MRIAFVSPLPPAKSGIADYSAAVVEHLRTIAEVETFAEVPSHFDAASFDSIIYQLGNNPFHTFVYEMALAHPGVVVLHEANLHHLIADLTIRRKNWDEYMRYVELDRGVEALAYAAKYVRTLERGPDYDGVPMLKRILRVSRGVIVHSRYVSGLVRDEGYEGPIAVIPHGAWLPTVADSPDRMAYRARLGVDEAAPLIGVFGFLKPYKRIAESLRAFARLIRVEPRARMILCGEAHEELPLESLLHSLNLTGHVRHIGFTPIEEFNGYLAASDIVLNLRFPTVGESSGTLLRALGLGKAVVVSDIGSFAEYPDDICFKAPVDAMEEDYLFEYLNLLVSRPQVARAIGDRARAWVEKECSWPHVAERYCDFLQAVSSGVVVEVEAEAVVVVTEVAAKEATPQPEPHAEYIKTWAPEPAGRSYVESHLTRLEKTLQITPLGAADQRILEMGAYLQITPALKHRLGYGAVRGCYYGPAGKVDRKEIASESGEPFICDIDLFDAEKDRFPYPDGHFQTILCCELLEHLAMDPMHMMSEVNRVLAPGGHFVVTTPNIASLRALSGILQGFHPMLFPAYIRPSEDGHADARHNREYAPREVADLLTVSGFEVTLLDTGPFREEPKPEFGWVEHLLKRYWLSTDLRGDGIYVVGRKTGPIRERYPNWLYS
jgi:glycosyltransferase involved in cell wall biosynthesis/SAM-dependent methyltransferase